ncbi:tRNA (adenosine(37)-N6)-threonylcarbamoyltransferase complex ATPase subunit type 1 TsaE [Candidatus Saccharibacteria bacterium]|nr:tRNA (adenosine(37)-N6)-threonylcarbamoyltransferase complex ATPase subunit type 1 TsaE [Candidatus Saccharibacteria bacterium]
MNIKSEQEMLTFGKKFAKQITTPAVIELIGDVGAGKTTFTRGLAQGLRIKKPVTSPSFTISKSYALPTGGHLIHYDFYRLSDPGLMQEDLSEAIQGNNIVIIEWGNSIQNILSENHIVITFSKNSDGSHDVKIKSKQNTISEKSLKPKTKNHSRSITKKTDSSLGNGAQLYLDTSTPETILKLNNQEYKYVFANDLAEKLLSFIQEKLTENEKTWHDISEITFMSGPGSFTGLRIGASIVNTLAHELNIPLYDHHGNQHQIIIPNYGRKANISQPKK